MSRSGRCKTVLLGDTGVGKSCLALRITKGYSHEHIETTIGAAFFPHSVQIDPDTVLKVDLWDTAGQERYALFSFFIYLDVKVILILDFILSLRCTIEMLRQV